MNGRTPGRPARGSACLVLLATAAFACGDRAGDPCAGKSGVAGRRSVALRSGGLERSFELVAPASALRGRPVPLVLLFHGSNGTGASQIAVSRFDAAAEAGGFLLAAGDGLGRSWNAGADRNPGNPADGVDDVGFTRDLVAAVEAEYCVDPARIDATGFSKGAEMVFRLACEASDLIAAFAPVAGALGLPGCAPATPRPLLIVHGQDDPVVPFALGRLSFQRFLSIDGCDDARETSAPAPTASCEAAPRCSGGATTALCAVAGLGHHWPGGLTDAGGAFDATAAIGAFFAAAGESAARR